MEQTDFSDCKTFATAAGAGCIRVVEQEAFTVQPTRKFQDGIEQVEKTFQVCDDFHPIIFERLVIGLRIIIEVQLIGQPGATPTCNTYAHKVVVPQVFLEAELGDFFFGAVCYKYHILWVIRELLRYRQPAYHFFADNLQSLCG